MVFECDSIKHMNKYHAQFVLNDNYSYFFFAVLTVNGIKTKIVFTYPVYNTQINTSILQQQMLKINSCKCIKC